MLAVCGKRECRQNPNIQNDGCELDSTGKVFYVKLYKLSKISLSAHGQSICQIKKGTEILSMISLLHMGDVILILFHVEIELQRQERPLEKCLGQIGH